MVARALWSPSRIKTALQCGRRLQGLEEGWERVEHIRGIRGRAVHKAVQTVEADRANASVVEAVVGAWHEILGESMPEGFEADEILKPVQALWELEAEIESEKDKAEANLAGEYKAPRRTKEFAKATAHLEPTLTGLETQQADIIALIDAVEWPWETDKGVYEEGFAHSLETTRKGVAYLAELWPTPDIIAAEWKLEADLGNGYRIHGYIDRVENTPTGVEVVDYKSSKYEDTPLDHFLQLATYAVLVEAHMGFAPDRVRLAYMRDRASDVFEVRPEWVDRLRALVVSADQTLESRSFSPTFAGCGICGFYPICSDEFDLTPIDIEEAS